LARIAGVDLPREKRLDIALTYIYGIGRTKAYDTCVGARVSPATKVRDLTDEEIVKLRDWIGDNYRVEGDLRREVNQNIKRKVEIGSYQGTRHRRGLPVHGQRTHTNARTRKGPKKQTVAGKKKASTGKKG
jgi:small subunit ribosomal protein S13